MQSALILQGAECIRGWKPAFILFLVALLPISPLLAQVQEDSMKRSLVPWEFKLAPIDSGRIPSLAGFEFVNAYQDSIDGYATGQGVADHETVGAGWFFFGFFLPPIAFIFSLVLGASGPDSIPACKSPKYIEEYTKGYKYAALWTHVKWTWIGIGSMFLLLLVGSSLAKGGSRNYL